MNNLPGFEGGGDYRLAVCGFWLYLFSVFVFLPFLNSLAIFKSGLRFLPFLDAICGFS